MKIISIVNIHKLLKLTTEMELNAHFPREILVQNNSIHQR
jgi:hypothetical protein